MLFANSCLESHDHIKMVVSFIIFSSGAWSRDWGVTFKNQCTLKGKKVVLKCEYDYPNGHEVTSVSWYKARLISGENWLTPLSRLSPPPDFKYLGNYRSDCSLEIKDVQHTDEGAYYFSFKTTYDRWRSTTGLYLFVKGNNTMGKIHQ